MRINTLTDIPQLLQAREILRAALAVNTATTPAGGAVATTMPDVPGVQPAGGAVLLSPLIQARLVLRALADAPPEQLAQALAKLARQGVLQALFRISADDPRLQLLLEQTARPGSLNPATPGPPLRAAPGSVPPPIPAPAPQVAAGSTAPPSPTTTSSPTPPPASQAIVALAEAMAENLTTLTATGFAPTAGRPIQPAWMPLAPAPVTTMTPPAPLAPPAPPLQSGAAMPGASPEAAAAPTLGQGQSSPPQFQPAEIIAKLFGPQQGPTAGPTGSLAFAATAAGSNPSRATGTVGPSAAAPLAQGEVPVAAPAAERVLLRQLIAELAPHTTDDGWGQLIRMQRSLDPLGAASPVRVGDPAGPAASPFPSAASIPRDVSLNSVLRQPGEFFSAGDSFAAFAGSRSNKPATLAIAVRPGPELEQAVARLGRLGLTVRLEAQPLANNRPAALILWVTLPANDPIASPNAKAAPQPEARIPGGADPRSAQATSESPARSAEPADRQPPQPTAAHQAATANPARPDAAEGGTPRPTSGESMLAGILGAERHAAEAPPLARHDAPPQPVVQRYDIPVPGAAGPPPRPRSDRPADSLRVRAEKDDVAWTGRAAADDETIPRDRALALRAEAGLPVRPADLAAWAVLSAMESVAMEIIEPAALPAPAG